MTCKHAVSPRSELVTLKKRIIQNHPINQNRSPVSTRQWRQTKRRQRWSGDQDRDRVETGTELRQTELRQTELRQR